MKKFPFYKLVPSGNPTIILSSEDHGQSLAQISEKLMSPLHLQAEQVGLLSAEQELPHLQMMGGEFCINATRAATLILARQGHLNAFGANCSQGFLTVSGASAPLHVLASPSEQSIVEKIKQCLYKQGELFGDGVNHSAGGIFSEPNVQHSTLFCAAKMSCSHRQLSYTLLDAGAFIVKMPGIVHLLLDQSLYPFEKNWQERTAHWREVAGFTEEPACGVVWYRKTRAGYAIMPAVCVVETNSEHLETACGSASFAMAFLHTEVLLQREAPQKTPSADSFANITSLEITQLSNEKIEVVFCKTPSSFEAYVCGEVRLVAEGMAYLES